jgi:hypothetical protein
LFTAIVVNGAFVQLVYQKNTKTLLAKVTYQEKFSCKLYGINVALKNLGKLREDFTTLCSSLETTMRPVWVKVATKYKVVSGVPLCI